MTTSTDTKTEKTVVAETPEVKEKKPRAPRAASDFTVVPETPPAAPNSAAGGQLYRALEQIAQTPNEWFRIASCQSRSGANSIWSTIKKGTRKTPLPLEQYEFTARIDAPNEASALYARFVGSDESK